MTKTATNIDPPCPFCRLELLWKGNEVKLRNEHCVFILNTTDILHGSGIIIPIVHRESVFDLTKDEWMATQDMLKEAKRFLDNAFKPDGYNVGWNCGRDGGQVMSHVHLHIISRFKDEPEAVAGKGIRHWYKLKENQRPRK